MLYRKFGKTDEMVSILGFGCMRLPVIPGRAMCDIDEEKAIKLIRHAIDEGVNYIDTAYPYHGTGFEKGGNSELLVAKALKDGYRKKVKVATKLPTWLVNTQEDFDRYLNEQLERLETDCIDFYLVHTIKSQLWPVLKEIRINDCLDRAIKDGRIKYAGFSYHDKLPLFKEVVDYYNWSFCLMQYNYMDDKYQAGTEGLKYAAERGLGIAVMEPLRGGKLAGNVPEGVKDILNQASVKRTPAELALRWVWNHPEVSLLLSGMNSMEQLEENLRSANEGEANSLTSEDLNIVEKVKAVFKEKIKVNCTGCEYCMPCPAGVDISTCFTMYNNYHIYGREFASVADKIDTYYMLVPPERRANNCVECGRCETHCPQGISIVEELRNVKAVFNK